MQHENPPPSTVVAYRRYGSTTAFWIGMLGIVAFGVLKAVLHYGSSLNVDEPTTAYMVHLPFTTMLFDVLPRNEPYSVPYLISLKFWTLIFGESEAALRSLSTLYLALTVAVVGLTARLAGGNGAGWGAALLLAASSRIGQTAEGVGQTLGALTRQYAQECLFIALALLLALWLMDVLRVGQKELTNRRAALVVGLLTIIHALGLLNHQTYLFVMAAFPLAALFVQRRAFWRLTLASALGTLIYLALWWQNLLSIVGGPNTNWMQPPGLVNLVRALSLWPALSTLVVVVGVLAAAFLARRQVMAFVTGKLGIALLAIVAFTSLAPFFISLIRPIFIDSRISILFMPALCVYVAMILTRPTRPALPAAVLAVVAVHSLFVSWQIWRAPDPFPVRAAVAEVLAQAQCGDAFVLGGLTYSEVTYYMRRQNAPDCLEVEVFPSSTLEHPGWMDVPGRLADRAGLQAEAAATAARLASRTKGTVWLFYSTGSRYAYEVTQVIVPELEQKYATVENYDLQGTFFDQVSRYSDAAASTLETTP